MRCTLWHICLGSYLLLKFELVSCMNCMLINLPTCKLSRSCMPCTLQFLTALVHMTAAAVTLLYSQERCQPDQDFRCLTQHLKQQLVRLGVSGIEMKHQFYCAKRRDTGCSASLTLTAAFCKRFMLHTRSKLLVPLLCGLVFSGMFCNRGVFTVHIISFCVSISRHGGAFRSLKTLLQHKLVHHESQKYDGYRCGVCVDVLRKAHRHRHRHKQTGHA